MVTQYMGRDYKITYALEDIHIAAYFGGLGDSLQFSTLPELFSEAGHNVYVWDKAYFRNPEIKELVWDLNPYIKGTKPGTWNAGDTPETWKVLHSSCISNWEMLHGFEPTNRLPKIYYKPNHLISYGDVVLIDLSSISTVYDIDALTARVREIKKDKFPDKKIVQVTFKKDLNCYIAPPGRTTTDRVFNFYDVIDEKLEIQSIFEYCDLMNSCYGLISLHNGASHLSSAIKEYNPDLESICIIPKQQYDDNKRRSLFIFDNIVYNTI